MKELAILRRGREGQPIISDCIKEMRQELEKYKYFRFVSQPMRSFINTIEKKKKKKTRQIRKRKKPPRSEYDEVIHGDLQEKMKMVVMDLPEKIDEIIYGHNISHDWCPRFLGTCSTVKAYSVMIYKELKKTKDGSRARNRARTKTMLPNKFKGTTYSYKYKYISALRKTDIYL